MAGTQARIRVGNLPLPVCADDADLSVRVMRQLRDRLFAADVPRKAVQLMHDALAVDLDGCWPFSVYSAALVDQFWRSLCAGLGDAPILCGRHRFYPDLRIALTGFGPHECALDSIDLSAPASAAESGWAASVLDEDVALCTLWLNDLRAGQLQLAFQPVYRLDQLDGGRCLYHEALVRRTSALTESPAAAIRALERQGLIGRLDWSNLWAVVSLLETRPGCVLACNVSAQTLRPNAWWREFIRYLQGRCAVASRLFIEITETSPFVHRALALELTRELQSLGVRIVLDDMGSGHADLAALYDTDYDAVKIDQSLLRQARQSPAGREILAWFTRACARSSPCVVIEGAENSDDLILVRNAGAQAAQGHFVGRPEGRPEWNFHEPCVVPNRLPQYGAALSFINRGGR
ncbi:EAL domain-containing protein [Castellaniella hirudinis]|uniref:EAL domain-containing protein n=1 Tax=Castellaniella hirudinis TaxID=1144617 RepID=UPI0039C23036